MQEPHAGVAEGQEEVIGPQRLALNRNGTRVVRVGVAESSDGVARVGETVQRVAKIGMLQSEVLLLDGQRALVIADGIVELAQSPVQPAQGLERRRNADGVLAPR